VTTLVLVHGGTVSSRMWDPVLPYLSGAAYAVDLPGRRHRPADLGTVTRQDWIDSVGDDIVANGFGDVVLVGHSSGGYVIPGVATLVPTRVRHLVFLTATVPAEGKAPVDYLKPKLQEMTRASERLQYERAKGKTLGDLRPGEPPIDTGLEVVENPPRMGLEAPGPLFEPFSWAGVPPREVVPRTYIRCLRDRVIPPDLASTMVENMGGADVIDLDVDHDVATSAPDVLAAVLDRLAGADRPG
jgi:pimeloyl-ACP methyl ester carboxylesterase